MKWKRWRNVSSLRRKAVGNMIPGRSVLSFLRDRACLSSSSSTPSSSMTLGRLLFEQLMDLSGDSNISIRVSPTTRNSSLSSYSECPFKRLATERVIFRGMGARSDTPAAPKRPFVDTVARLDMAGALDDFSTLGQGALCLTLPRHTEVGQVRPT